MTALPNPSPFSSRRTPASPDSPGTGSPARCSRLAAAAVVAAALAATTAPAMAQELPHVALADGPGDASFAYSADGVVYSASVPELFANSPKLVPGNGLEEKLWVRNDTSIAVNVSVAALSAAGTGETARVGLTPSPVVTLEPGIAAPLNVRLWLPDTAGNATQGQTWPVQLHVSVSEAVPAADAELPSTGATGGIWPLSVAALLGGAGAYLGARKRGWKP